MLLKVWLYLTSMIKYLIGLTILCVIIAFFFPPAAGIVFLLGLLGSFGAAKDDVAEKYSKVLAKREYKRLMKVAEKSKHEFEGFEKAMTLTRRSMT